MKLAVRNICSPGIKKRFQKDHSGSASWTPEEQKSNQTGANISVHNSKRELEQTPELLERLDICQKTFVSAGCPLPYCEKIIGADLPEQPMLIMVLHGAGSVGHDNFLQMRIPSEPLIRFLEKKKRKYVLLFPQCDIDHKWVDVPWNSTAHTLPEMPSKYMTAALELLDEKTAEYSPRARGAIGISMGGYGVWDMACRRELDLLGVMCGGADTSLAARFKNTRICIYHGADDNVVPVCRARDMAEALQKAGNTNFMYNELPDTLHNAWDPFFFDGIALPMLFDGF